MNSYYDLLDSGQAENFREVISHLLDTYIHGVLRPLPGRAKQVRSFLVTMLCLNDCRIHSCNHSQCMSASMHECVNLVLAAVLLLLVIDGRDFLAPSRLTLGPLQHRNAIVCP